MRIALLVVALTATCVSLHAQDKIQQRIERPIAAPAARGDAAARKLGRQGRFDLIDDVPVRRGRVRPPPDVDFKKPVIEGNEVEQRMWQQLRPMLQIELNLVKTVCAPTKEQMRQIRQVGEQHLKGAVNDEAEMRNRRANLERAPLTEVRRQQKSASDALKLLQEKLAASVESRLSVGQAARYRSEVEKRNANRRQVCVRNVVATLDQELSLSALQREEISQSLSWSWKDDWCQTVEVSAMQGQDYIPHIPDELVVPHLDATQKDLWQGMRKVSFSGVPVGFLGMRLEDADDE